MLVIILYGLLLSALTIYSYGFVDPNLTLSINPLYQKFHQPLFELVFNHRPLSTTIFILIILLFTIYYLLSLWLVARKRLGFQQLKWLIAATLGILLFSYPAFSYDIFNYILTAKVTFFYKENPYLVMPIELIGEPNLAFTRAANKIALYGPSWIGLTAVPYLLGFNNIVTAIFSFKLFIAAFYIAMIWLIWKFSKNIYSVVLFALNPVVIIETLVSAHNDIVMMFFALLAFYLIKANKVVRGIIFLILSILVKFATFFLTPIFIFAVFKALKKEKIPWERIFHISGWTMFAVFLLSPLREEFYPWYVIWILSFAALVPKRKFLLTLVLTLSFSTLFRYVPVLYTGNYFGVTPMIKELVTFTPFLIVLAFWLCRRIIVHET